MEIYDSYESNKNYDMNGITGEVQRYIKETVSYPYFLIESTPDCPVQLNKLQILPNLFGTVDIMQSSASSIFIYYKDGENVVKLGKIAPRQVKSFLRLFTGNNITGMYDDKTVLTGDYLYVLSD